MHPPGQAVLMCVLHTGEGSTVLDFLETNNSRCDTNKREGRISKCCSWPGVSAAKRPTLLGVPKTPGKQPGPSFKKNTS